MKRHKFVRQFWWYFWPCLRTFFIFKNVPNILKNFLEYFCDVFDDFWTFSNWNLHFFFNILKIFNDNLCFFAIILKFFMKFLINSSTFRYYCWFVNKIFNFCDVFGKYWNRFNNFYGGLNKSDQFVANCYDYLDKFRDVSYDFSSIFSQFFLENFQKISTSTRF